ncbi:MAG TPA: TldD/PmbA family protein, partial [Trueperaceae bacterium]|nr:TldD/PmbA family protein [Trueperaceae bacterium]
SVAEKVSVLSDKLGEQVASKTVTYVDDGTIKNAWGSSEYDDEGLKTERTVLIENGILNSYMVDRLGGLKTGYKATGSGRRQDYTFAPTSRMRNTFITNGNTKKEDLFSGIEYGIYAKSMGGGEVKPGSGEYNFGVKEGYIIRNGKIEEPIKGAMLLGKGPESIKKIIAVSDDLVSGPGMCGSLSGSIPTEVGQPHVLISDIVVGGEA